MSVGTDHDAAVFAVETTHRCYTQIGAGGYPDVEKLLICADGGGSNGYRLRVWKAKFAAGLSVHAELDVNTYPTGIMISDTQLAALSLTATAATATGTTPSNPATRHNCVLFTGRPLLLFISLMRKCV